MPKLMIRIIMSLGAVLLSTAPITQTFAQVKQREAQTSGMAVADSSSASESDSLQLLRPGATAIFPVAESADSVAAVPAAPISTAGWVGIGVLIALAILGVLLLIAVIACSGGGCS